MKLIKLANGKAMRIVDENTIVVVKGVYYWKIDADGNRISDKHYLGSILERLISCNRVLSQLLRVSIHHVFPIKNDELLITTKKHTYIVNQNGNVVSTFTGYRGNKPAQRAICCADNGDIFFGEYTINLSNKNPTSLYRSTDNGRTFKEIYRFDKNQIRHIHFIQWDHYEHCLWMGTGDKDNECLLMRSNDYGDNWVTIGGGSQKWRAVSLIFTQDYIYWGTDAGNVPDPSCIIKMNRITHDIEIIAQVTGPCHSGDIDANGNIFISTGVEGGENEADRFARMYKTSNDRVEEVYKIKKDIFPLIVQYGIIRFPLGLEISKKIIFTTLGLVGGGERVYKVE